MSDFLPLKHMIILFGILSFSNDIFSDIAKTVSIC